MTDRRAAGGDRPQAGVTLPFALTDEVMLREAFRRLASRANNDFIRGYPKAWQELQEALAPFQVPA